MKSKLSMAVVSGVALATLSVSTAFAWSFVVTGEGACQKDGTYLITWVVDNHTESEPLQITKAVTTPVYDPTVVPAGTQVAAKSKQSFTQKVDGSKAGTWHSLNINGHWASDKKDRNDSDTVYQDTACVQPTVAPVTPPAAGGMGAGTTEQVAATTPVVAQPQVVAPVGAVNAGSGTQVMSLSAISGLVASAAAFVLGLRRLNKEV